MSNGRSQVDGRFETLIKLMALLVSHQHPSLTEKAVALRRAGLTPTEIAELCGTSSNSVAVRLAEAKRKQQPAKKSSRRKK